MASKPICVTGATGYLAAYIIRDLLAKGHRVRGTVRSLKNEQKLAPLRALPGAADALDLVEADMLRPSCFDAMLQGCCGLIHTACPIEIPMDGSPPASTMEEAQTKQLSPAVDGTSALLRSASSAGIGRIVLTSSIAAMRFTATPADVVSEGCWSDEAFLREQLFLSGPACYALAKTLQEREAWRLAEELGLDLVVINPALIIGPSLTTHLNFSLELLLSVLEGRGSPFDVSTAGTLPDKYKSWVDVREVSEAHVLAFEKEDAEGRYFLQSSSAHYADVVAILRKHPSLSHKPEFPIDSPDGIRESKSGKFDNSKAQRLGVNWIPLEQSVKESVDSLVAAGFIKPAKL